MDSQHDKSLHQEQFLTRARFCGRSRACCHGRLPLAAFWLRNIAKTSRKITSRVTHFLVPWFRVPIFEQNPFLNSRKHGSECACIRINNRVTRNVAVCENMAPDMLLSKSIIIRPILNMSGRFGPSNWQEAWPEGEFTIITPQFAKWATAYNFQAALGSRYWVNLHGGTESK